MTTNDELYARARRVIPGGVDSPVRAFGSVGGTPYFVARAEGPHVWDVEGNRYLDLVQSYGAIILGHAHPAVVDAVQDAAGDGTSYGAPTEREVVLAELLTARVEGCDVLRFVNSGTEATMSAIRVARGFTGRDRVVKFAGCYHGHSDGLLVEGGTAMATLGLPGSAGVPGSSVADTVVAPYNEVAPLDEQVACVIVEPIAANMGVVPPRPGFLEGLRAACDEVGALLIFDEVITGFRIAGGGAQEVYGVRPDLWTFGKVIGGGLPVGAFGGRADVMAVLAPDGRVYQAGTLSGNPLAMAAGIAAVSLLDASSYAVLADRANRLAKGLHDALTGAGHAVQVPVAGTLVGLRFADEPAVDYATARDTDEVRYARFFHELLARGVAIAPGAYEALFVGLAHTDEIIDDIVARAADAAGAMPSAP